MLDYGLNILHYIQYRPEEEVDEVDEEELPPLIDLFLGIAMPIVPVIEDGAKTYNIGRRIQEYKSASTELHSSPQPSPMPNLHQPHVELSDVNRSFLTGLSPNSTPQTVFVTFLFDLSFWVGSNTCSTARSSLGHPLTSQTTPEIN